MKSKNCNDNKIEFKHIEIDLLSPYSSNSRKHSQGQIEKIATSIEQFGFLNPILVDAKSKIIIAGHGRLEAAKLLKLESVPIISIDGLSENQIRAYVITDNRLADLAEWDYSILAEELGILDAENYCYEITGFDIDELDKMINGFSSENRNTQVVENEEITDFDNSKTGSGENEPENSVEISGRVVSKPEYIWDLGGHKLKCSDENLDECDKLVQFWQELTGEEAILDDEGLSFEELLNAGA